MGKLYALLHGTLAGDRDAWHALQLSLEPTISAIARCSRALRSRGLASSPDDIRDIVVASLGRLAAGDFQNLRRFAQRVTDPQQADELFDTWIYGAVDYEIREHLRRRFGRAPKQSSALGGQKQLSKRDLQSHAGRLSDDDGDRSLLNTLGTTNRLTARQILEHVSRTFSSEETDAVRMYYLEESDFAAIASALGMAHAAEAERLIRRINARLRYHFATPTEPELDRQ